MGEGCEPHLFFPIVGVGEASLRPLSWPMEMPIVTREFGVMPNVPPYGLNGHNGIDIIPTPGETWFIRAAADGQVLYRLTLSDLGNMIQLVHENNMMTVYGHLFSYEEVVQPTVSVKRGDILGIMGATGWVTGPHLHFGVLKDGVHVNPRDYLEVINE